MELYTSQIILGLLLGYFLFNLVVIRSENRLLAVVNSWLRWLLFSLLVAGLFAPADVGVKNPAFWRLALGAFLLWLLVQTVYTWVLIAALNRSNQPIFPRFRENLEGDAWPLQNRFQLLRQWLRSRGFHKLQHLESPLGGDMVMRSSVYLSEDATVLLHILFSPKQPNMMQAQYVLMTLTEEDEVVMTDNIDIGYGGYYPDNWFVERRPLVHSLEKLLNLHKRRLLRGGVNVRVWDEDLDVQGEMNQSQKELIAVNIAAGFLTDPRYEETGGRLTSEGRYRLWKEMLLLKYLGRALK